MCHLKEEGLRLIYTSVPSLCIYETISLSDAYGRFLPHDSSHRTSQPWRWNRCKWRTKLAPNLGFLGFTQLLPYPLETHPYRCQETIMLLLPLYAHRAGISRGESETQSSNIMDRTTYTLQMLFIYYFRYQCSCLFLSLPPVPPSGCEWNTGTERNGNISPMESLSYGPCHPVT